MNTQTNNAATALADAIIASATNINSQLHGVAKGFRHYAEHFRAFAAQDKPFMLVKVMATPQRHCRVPTQAMFFDTKEELMTTSVGYRVKEVREDGLDVMFVDMFEWDLGIDYLPPVELN